MKYKYGKRHNPDCKHIWGKNMIGHDKTQFCIKCGQWRAIIMED